MSISGLGGGTKKVDLTASQRNSIGTLDTFGLAVPGLDYDSHPGQLHLYIDSVSYTAELCVLKNPPEADAGVDQEVEEETQVTLDGSESDDSDGTIVSYLWEQTAGTPTVTLENADKAVASFTAPNVTESGASLIFRLTVIDDMDLPSTDSCLISVTGVNDPPTADAGRDQKAVEGAEVKLDGSKSTDPDDGITSYQWEQIGGLEVNLSGSELAQCYFIAPNVEKDRPWLTFRLTVKDGVGLESSDICKVHVMEPKAMPWIPLLLFED